MKKLSSFTKASLCVNYWLSDADLASLLTLADNLDTFLNPPVGVNSATSYTVSAGTKALDLSTANWFYPAGDAVAEGNLTFTFTNVPAAVDEVFEFYVEVFVNFTDVTFPSNVRWSGGLPTTPGSVPGSAAGTPKTVWKFVTRNAGADYFAVTWTDESFENQYVEF